MGTASGEGVAPSQVGIIPRSIRQLCDVLQQKTEMKEWYAVPSITQKLTSINTLHLKI